jgi:zinc/manganese transport system ATP-binding protein
LGCGDPPARDQIAYLPQVPEIDRQFPISVLDTALLGHWRKIGWHRGIGPALHHQARHALARVGLAGFEQRPIGTLSAGQFQRALFARLMVQDAPVMLLDEPFSAIDARTTSDLIALVEDWHRDGRTVIAVLHDLEQVRRHFPETLLLARTCIAWGATAQVLTPAHLLQAQSMAESWDPHATPCDTAVAL